jgi:hypothetical protein
VVDDAKKLQIPYLLVTDKKNSAFATMAQRIMRIDYRPDYKPGDGTFPFPFPMFSQIYADKQDLELAQYRKTPKKWKVFFGGDARFGKYNKYSIRKVYKKIPRGVVLEVLRNQLNTEDWVESHHQEQLDALLGKVFDGLVIVNTRHCKIPVNQWLSVLSSASFYLACPGTRYPMSHNVIESLAVGTVPIIQYPELFFPPLTDGKNCLVYSDEKDLVAVVRRALSMSEQDIAALAEGAMLYYESYLHPSPTISNLLANPAREIQVRLLPFLKADGGYA